jgi:uncharacterized damage-inducible protein DinB
MPTRLVAVVFDALEVLDGRRSAGNPRPVAHHNADGSDPDPSVPPMLTVPRPDEAAPADELSMLRGWLTYLRGGAIHKLADLDADQLRWRPSPTANSLGGIVMHLGYSERLWLRVIFDGEEMDMAWTENRYAPTFLVPDGWTTDDVVAFYREETAAVDAVLDGADTADLPSRGRIRPTTLRWVMDHLVEEIARHLGHMDITRELLDGRTGR